MPLTLTDAQTIDLQEFVPSLQHGANQLFSVGSNFYFVILAQVGTVPTNDLQVYKSSDKITWSLVATYAASGAPLQTNASQDAPCCLVNGVIYILGVLIDSTGPATVRMLFHPFDTITDSFLADSALSGLQGGAGQQLWSCSPLNDGRIVVSSTITPGPHLTTQTYVPATDSWSAVTNQTNDSSKPLQQIHDPATDRTFIFYQKAATSEMRCLVLDATPAAVGDVTVFTLVAGPVFISIIGMPTVSNGEVIIPYRWFPIAAAPEQRVARATVADSPAFSIELVEDTATLPVPSQVQQWDQIAGPGSFMITIDGLLYCFYVIDNGQVDDATSQSFLYYRTSPSAGIWSDPAIAYTSNVPGEMMTPYGVIDQFGNPLIILGVVDPTLWDDVSSLTNFVLFVPNAPQVGYASGKIINAALLRPVALDLDYMDNTMAQKACFPMTRKGSC